MARSSSRSAKLTANSSCASCEIPFAAAPHAAFGGARSGKTFLLVRAVMMRAVHAPGTRHAMLRLRADAARASLWLDTLPQVQRAVSAMSLLAMTLADWMPAQKMIQWEVMVPPLG